MRLNQKKGPDQMLTAKGNRAGPRGGFHQKRTTTNFGSRKKVGRDEHRGSTKKKKNYRKKNSIRSNEGDQDTQKPIPRAKGEGPESLN